MIKILKLENIFGINKVIGANQLDKTNVIYAPNGTAKSSISDALFNIPNGESVNDVLDDSKVPSYQIDVDGTTFDGNNTPNYKIIKYSGIDEFELGDLEDYKPLVISPLLQSKVKTSLSIIKNAVNNIENILLKSFPKKGKGRGEIFSKGLKEAISLVAKTTQESELIINFAKNLNTSAKPISETISEEDFLVLVNKKSFEVINNPSVQANLNEYATVVNKRIVSEVLDDEFKIDNLANFYNHTIEDNYFDSNKKRLLSISGVVYDKESFKELVDKETIKVFDTDEIKQKVSECKSVLSKTASSTKLTNRIISSPVLLSRAANYDSFVNELFVTMIGPSSLKLIEIERSTILAEQAKLSLLKSSFSDNDNCLHKIWELYKTRFNFNKFDLTIKNRFDAAIGYDVPLFVKCVKGTDIEINNPRDFRFSTGEIRSYNLINLIIEIEKERMKGEPFTIVLDDAVDSFDYKNKYGIIDYLVDANKDPNIQLIVFTHNFDFYRSSILAFGKGTTNQYFMYKDDNNDITFHDSKNKHYYLEVCKFNDWKNTPTISQYFALIPFFRSTLQLESNSHNSDVQTIDEYLHYDDSLSSARDFTRLDTILKSKGCNLPSGVSVYDKFLEKLNAEVASIISAGINETNLEEKITLGLYIRLFGERFLCKKIVCALGTIPPTGIYSRTKDLLNYAISSNLLNESEIFLLTEANIISPSFLHANSFMYEPLIDVGSKPLVDIAGKLRVLNDPWPL